MASRRMTLPTPLESLMDTPSAKVKPQTRVPLRRVNWYWPKPRSAPPSKKAILPVRICSVLAWLRVMTFTTTE